MLLSWRRRHNVPPKLRCPPIRLHDVIHRRSQCASSFSLKGKILKSPPAAVKIKKSSPSQASHRIRHSISRATHYTFTTTQQAESDAVHRSSRTISFMLVPDRLELNNASCEIAFFFCVAEVGWLSCSLLEKLTSRFVAKLSPLMFSFPVNKTKQTDVVS